MGKRIELPAGAKVRNDRSQTVGPRGGHTGKERTITKGEKFPPTPEPGQGFVLVDKTKH